MSGTASDAHERLIDLARHWRVTVRETFETPSSVIAHGWRGSQPVVLKVVREPGDEWKSGEVLRAFGGRGMVEVYEHVDGAMLLERVEPGEQLADMVRAGGDREATTILADVIASMSPHDATAFAPTVRDWADSFAWYGESGDRRLDPQLVARAERVYMHLCESQRSPRLLHGDLQHYNVLLDRERGWVAIDPKGAIGEVEYEIGASLRNPGDQPELFANPETIERRVRTFSEKLALDPKRILAWAFAEGVLSAIWGVEDRDLVEQTDPGLLLAGVIERMLGGP